MQDAYEQILRAYNPLEIKDILLPGASRKATQHKDADDITTYYANYNEGIHHNLLDAKFEYCRSYLLCQAAYNRSENKCYNIIRRTMLTYTLLLSLLLFTPQEVVNLYNYQQTQYEVALCYTH